MNKKEFLNSLEKKLSVLDDKEKQDIIIEYTDTINEKIKQGQTEEEAVKDFGNIDDLVKEILIAYKINPNYEEKPDKDQKVDGLIKQGAEVVSDFSRKAIKKCNITSKDINLEFIVEIIIRIFIVLIAALVLKGVFTIFGDIGSAIFDNFYDPMGSLFTLFWNILLFAIYILVTVLMVVAIFKKYFKIGETSNIQAKEKEEIKPKNEKNINKNTNKPENNKQVKTPKEKKGATLGDICLLIVKIFVIIYVIVPFIVIDCFIILGLIYSFILLIKGINLIGLVLLLIGMSSLFTYLIKLLFSLLFGKGKASIIPVIISIVLMIFGTIMFIDMIMNVEVIETQTDEKDFITETKEFNTNKKAYIHYVAGSEHKQVDENMPDGKFTVTLKYNKDRNILKLEEDQNYLMNDCDYNYENSYYEYEDEYENYQECTQSTYFFIDIYDEKEHGTFNEFKDNYNHFIEDLKDNKLYIDNSSYLPEMTITANQKTLNMIKTNN